MVYKDFLYLTVKFASCIINSISTIDCVVKLWIALHTLTHCIATFQISILGLLKCTKETPSLHTQTTQILTQLKEIVCCTLWMNYKVLKWWILKQWPVGTIIASPNSHCHLQYIIHLHVCMHSTLHVYQSTALKTPKSFPNDDEFILLSSCGRPRVNIKVVAEDKVIKLKLK